MERSTTIAMIKKINNGHHCLSPQQQHHHQQSMDHPPYFAFPPKPPLGNASFSSCLIRPNHQDIHVNTSQADDSEICIFDARKYFNETNNSINIDSKAIVSSNNNNNNRVSPLNVISNNNNNNNLELISEHRISSDVSALPRSSCSSSVDGYGRKYRARSSNATPTASSEASWNSQTGLLQNPPGAVAISMRNPAAEEKKRGGRTSSKWQLFGRKCPCSGKKSVQVEEKASSSPPVVSVSVSVSAEPKTPAARFYNNDNNNNRRQIQKSLDIPVDESFQSGEIITNIRRISATGLGQQRVNIAAPGRPHTDATPGFTFPILNQTASMKLVLNNAPLLEDPPRESLEIFQPPSDQETAASRNSTRHSFTFPASPGRTRMTTDDDVASDTSSDLFEIESFSTQTTTYPMYRRRDSLDEAASFNARRLAAANGNSNLMYCARGSLDEPATPSIAATECYEPSEASIDWSVTTAEAFDRGSVTNYSVTASEVDDVGATRHGGGSSKKKGNGGMLLSCRCEKAVSVVGPNPVKCVAGSGMRHVSSRACSVNNSSKPPLPRSQSHTLSLPFAT